MNSLIQEFTPITAIDTPHFMKWANGKGKKLAPNLALVEAGGDAVLAGNTRQGQPDAPPTLQELTQYIATEQLHSTGLQDSLSAVRCDRSTKPQPFNLMFETHAGLEQTEENQGLPPPRNRPRHLRQLPQRPRQLAAQAAVRDRPGRQGVPQRDHPAQLHLPLPRVRADGDRVLLPSGRVDEVVRVLARPAQEVVHARSASSRDNLRAARAGQGGTGALLDRHHRHRVHVPVLARSRRNWKASPTAATST